MNLAYFRLTLREIMCLKCFSLDIYFNKGAWYILINLILTKQNGKLCDGEKWMLQICKISVTDWRTDTDRGHIWKELFASETLHRVVFVNQIPNSNVLVALVSTSVVKSKSNQKESLKGLLNLHCKRTWIYKIVENKK